MSWQDIAIRWFLVWSILFYLFVAYNLAMTRLEHLQSEGEDPPFLDTLLFGLSWPLITIAAAFMDYPE